MISHIAASHVRLEQLCTQIRQCGLLNYFTAVRHTPLTTASDHCVPANNTRACRFYSICDRKRTNEQIDINFATPRMHARTRLWLPSFGAWEIDSNHWPVIKVTSVQDCGCDLHLRLPDLDKNNLLNRAYISTYMFACIPTSGPQQVYSLHIKCRPMIFVLFQFV